MLLKKRDHSLTEAMERPDCNRRLLFNTYRQFEYINRLMAGWHDLYKTYIRPALIDGDSCRLLDIGFGGGDLPLSLHEWADRDGLKLQITAIETDRRALEFVRQNREIPDGITFRHASTDQLVEKQARFDFVISNHLIHHLSVKELKRMADQARQLSTRKVIFNDLQRSVSAYLLFSLFIAPFFKRSFAGSDGRLSIRRSFTASEFQRALPEGWTVHRKFPFRLIGLFDHERTSR